MAKRAYIGVNNVARKIKNMYIGINGIARKVQKVYIGIGGVARPCWVSGGDISYYGTLSSGLSSERYNLAATTVGNYALFGGGSSSDGATSVVDAYNKSLTRTTATQLSLGRNGLAATTVGNYALFGGGSAYSSSSGSGANYTNTVDAYDASLTRTIPTQLSLGKRQLAATTVGNYALFGGGVTGTSSSNSYSCTNTVDAYDTSLTRKNPTQLYLARCNIAATTVGNYALFGGGSAYSSSSGSGANYTNTVDAYNASLTRSNPTQLSVVLNNSAATTVGNYALFGGGFSSSGMSSVVNAYNTNLTRTNATQLSLGRDELSATTVGNFALFGGGKTASASNTSDNGRVARVDAYDTSLTRKSPTELSSARSNLAATTVGDYALFGGGYRKSFDREDIVDAYSI